MVSRDPGKLPRRFEIHDLVMRGLGHGDGATFDATLTNPTPRGEIATRGTFGPWQAGDPNQTPVRCEYTFKSANLDTIRGIGGTPSSVGTYSGVLERIDVKGETVTPDFRHSPGCRNRDTWRNYGMCPRRDAGAAVVELS